MPDLVSRYDRDLRLVYVNEATCAATGRAADELLGLRLGEVAKDQVIARRIEAAVQEVFRSGDGRSLEHELATPEGPMWFSVHLFPERGPDGAVARVAATARDLTSRKRTEDALRASEADLREAQAMAGIGSWSGDMTTGVMTWSAEMFKILGYDAGEVEPHVQAFRARISAGDTDRAGDALARCLAEREPLDARFELTVPEGGSRCVHLQAGFDLGPGGSVLRVHGTLQDVTEQTEQARDLERSRALLDGVLQSSVDGIMAFRSVREDGEIVDFEWLLANPAANRIVGRDDDLIGRRLLEEMPGNLAAGLFAAYVDVVRTGQPFETEHHYSHDGLDNWFHTVAVRLGDGFAVTFADVSERRRAEAELRHRQLHDPLTGLANRTLLVDRLRHALERRERTDDVVALLVVDVHRLRAVNEAHGHDGGDTVLRAVAGRLRALSRSSDTVGRLGSDEFLVLSEGLDASEADALARRLLAASSAPIDVGAAEVRVEVGIGVVMVTATSVDVERLLSSAHTAVLQAKALGPGRHAFFDDEMQAAVAARAELEAELREAIEGDQLVVLYQPVVRTDDLTVAGFEALVRWQHPERGLLPPSEFIPLAEDTGLVVPIGHVVLLEACRQRAAWAASLGRRGEIEVAVNLSARELAEESIVSRVKHALDVTGIPPAHLCLEITETGLLDVAAAPETLGRLVDLGVRIALDDFGTGFSSVGHLRRFPVDVLKIDRSFVADLPQTNGAPPVVAALVALAHTLHLDVVAEGVETPAQLRAVRRLGVQRAQGYHFARPLSAGEATAMLDRAEPADAAAPLPALGAPADSWDERALELVRRLPAHFLVVLDEAYTIRWASHHAGRILSTSASSLIGRPAFELVHPEDLELVALELGRLHDEAAPELTALQADLDSTAQVRLLAEDGSVISVQFKGFNLFADPDVMALGLLGNVVSSQVRLDGVIDRLGTDAPLDDVLGLLGGYLTAAVGQPGHRIVRFVGGAVIGSDGQPVADDPLVPAGVVAAALGAGAERSCFSELASLTAEERSALTELGCAACFIHRIVAPGESTVIGAVLTWTRGATLPLAVHEAMATTARLAGIAMAVHGAADQFRTAAMTDALTGLANRRQLDAWADAVQGSAAVLAIDVDDLKPVNDLHGHAVGDVVLTEVAARLVASCRPGALVARPGGDEFVVLVPGVDQPEDAEAVGARFADAMATPIDFGDRLLHVAASVGWTIRAPGEPVAEALARADAALYDAKKAGKHPRGRRPSR